MESVLMLLFIFPFFQWSACPLSASWSTQRRASSISHKPLRILEPTFGTVRSPKQRKRINKCIFLSYTFVTFQNGSRFSNLGSWKKGKQVNGGNLLPVDLGWVWERVAGCLSSMGLRRVKLGAWTVPVSEVSVVKLLLPSALKNQICMADCDSTVWGDLILPGKPIDQFTTFLTLPRPLAVLLFIDPFWWPFSPNSCCPLLGRGAAWPEHCVKGGLIILFWPGVVWAI